MDPVVVLVAETFNLPISYSLQMETPMQFEYVQARRDCSVTIVETENYHWYRHNELMFDKAIWHYVR